MDTDFTHLLLTRFNTAIGYAPSSKRLERDWLTGRLALFEQYCFPSVAAQRNAQFRWLVFFDAASPEWFRDKISGFGHLMTSVYIDGPATDDVIATAVRETGLVTTPFLITTRLDNDDAIAADHLAIVQAAFHRQHREFIVFPFGLQSLHGHLYNVYWPSNPFLSLIEEVASNGEFTTVLCVPHDRVRDAGRVRKIPRSPQWLQVLHDSNLLNALRGWPRLSSSSHTDFRVLWPAPLQADSLTKRMKYSVRSYADRALKLAKKANASVRIGNSGN